MPEPVFIEPPRAANFAGGMLFSLSAASQQSEPFMGRALRLASTQPAYYVTGENPVAAADGTSALLPANCIEIIAIERGHRIAVLQAGSAGTLTVTPT